MIEEVRHPRRDYPRALFGALLTAGAVYVLVGLLSTNIAVLVLRRDRVEHDHFRVWTVVPVLGALSCVLLLTQQEPMVWLFAAILIAVGVGLFFLARLGRRADPVE